MKRLTIDQLIAKAEEKARQVADGHLTIFRFTIKGWAVMFDTPCEREEIISLPTYPSLRQALTALLKG